LENKKEGGQPKPITEAVARYLHDAILEKEERQEGSELA